MKFEVNEEEVKNFVARRFFKKFHNVDRIDPARWG